MKSTFILQTSLILLLLFTPVASFADEGNRGAATSLGWVAIGAGILGNVPFILYLRVRKLSITTLGGGDSLTRDLALQHKPLLNVHMALNLVGFAAGAAHGIVLLRGLDGISLSLAIVMTFLVLTGIILRFSSRSMRIFAKLVHTQVIISALLIILVFLHVLFMS